MLRAPIWMTSAYSSTSSSDSLSMASVMILMPELVANLGHDLQPVFAQALKRVGRSTRLVGASAEELRAGARDTRSATAIACSRLSMAQGPAMMARPGPANGGVRPCKTDDGIVELDVAADQFVGLADADEFLDAGHLFERARLRLRPCFR